MVFKKNSNKKSVSKKLFKLLTEGEIIELLDLLINSISNDEQRRFIETLSDNTGKIVKSILFPLSDTGKTAKKPRQEESVLKKGETWKSLWKEVIRNSNSVWYHIYMELSKEFSKEDYLANCLDTIEEDWTNAFPIIENLIDKKNYGQSGKIVNRALKAFLKANGGGNWDMEKELLCIKLFSPYCNRNTIKEDVKLLALYQTTLQNRQITSRSSTGCYGTKVEAKI